MKDKISPPTIFNARTIGAFFLLVFLAYGFGQYFFESKILAEQYLGATLIITNSVMVCFIGILFKKTLDQYNLKVGTIYLYSRIFEAVVLACTVLPLFGTINISKDFFYFLAMLVLGPASIQMCLTLFKHKIIVPFFAIWGIVGYSIFSFGFLMELFGLHWSIYLLGLAGLWEITFGIWLIAKSFKKSKYL